jgi:hypothetical protein
VRPILPVVCGTPGLSECCLSSVLLSTRLPVLFRDSFSGGSCDDDPLDEEVPHAIRRSHIHLDHHHHHRRQPCTVYESCSGGRHIYMPVARLPGNSKYISLRNSADNLFHAGTMSGTLLEQTRAAHEECERQVPICNLNLIPFFICFDFLPRSDCR